MLKTPFSDMTLNHPNPTHPGALAPGGPWSLVPFERWPLVDCPPPCAATSLAQAAQATFRLVLVDNHEANKVIKATKRPNALFCLMHFLPYIWLFGVVGSLVLEGHIPWNQPQQPPTSNKPSKFPTSHPPTCPSSSRESLWTCWVGCPVKTQHTPSRKTIVEGLAFPKTLPEGGFEKQP